MEKIAKSLLLLMLALVISLNAKAQAFDGYAMYTEDNFAYLINQDGEIEHHANYPSSILNYPSGALVKNDSTGFLVKNYWNDFTHVKNNLEIDSIISIFPFTFPTIFFATPNMIKELNDTTFLIAGRRFIDQSSESDYAIRSVENMSDLVHEHIIETDTASSPALNVSIDFQNTNQIYFGGWQRNPPQTLYESPTQSSLPGWFILTQLNETLEPNWTRYYGGDSHYVMQGLIATKDGGCLMYGSRYDEVEGRDIYILKVGPNGLLTSTTTPETTTNITVYPNPTSNYIFFDTGEASMYDVSFFDGLGKVIFQEKIPNNRPVDVRHLPVGIYTYVLERKGEIVSQGKWVKE